MPLVYTLVPTSCQGGKGDSLVPVFWCVMLVESNIESCDQDINNLLLGTCYVKGDWVAMPRLPDHPCAQPGCPALVPAGTSRCPRHPSVGLKRPYQRPASDAFYGTNTWKQFRARVLERRKNQWGRWTCVRCGRSTTSPQLDHILPRAQYPALELDEGNMRVLCISCHSGRTLGDINRR